MDKLHVIALIIVGTLVMSAQGYKTKTREKRSSAAKGHFPFMVEIRIFLDDHGWEISGGFHPGYANGTKSNGTKTCSGTIIYPTMILTSCRCVYTGVGDKYWDSWRYTVFAGTRNREDGSPRFQERRVERVIPHPSCQIIPNDIAENDVAILVLNQDLDYSAEVDQVTVAWDLSELEWIMAGKDALLKPNDDDDDDDDDEYEDPVEETAKAQECVVLGFKNGPAPPSGKPKKLLMDKYHIIDGSDCNEKFCSISKTDPMCTRRFWCLGEMCGVRNDTSTGCNVDTGGPIVCNNKVYGVDSYRSEGCKNKKAPSRFPNLRAIKETMIALCNNPDARRLARTPRLEPLPEHRAHTFVIEIDIQEASTDNPRDTSSVAHHRCTGTVFTSKMVMTACHCVAHYNLGKPLTFYEGWQVEVLSASRKRWNEETPKIKVHKIVPHPNCTRRSGAAFFENDVAMLLLTQPLELGTEVNKIDLGLGLGLMERNIDLKLKCFVAGLGLRTRKGTPSKQLLEGSVFLNDDDLCKKKICKVSSPKEGFCSNKTYEKSGYVCALRETPQSCFGHTGGPLVCEGEVYGIDTVGLECKESFPSLFTRLSVIDQLYSLIEKDPKLKELAGLPSCRGCPD